MSFYGTQDEGLITPVTLAQALEGHAMSATESPLLKLPPEILNDIVGFMADDAEGLANLALVSSNCRQMARSQQFSTVRLNVGPSSRGLMSALLHEVAERQLNDGKTRKPSISACVRSIKVGMVQFEPRTGPPHDLPWEDYEEVQDKYDILLKQLAYIIRPGGLPNLDSIDTGLRCWLIEGWFLQSLLGARVRRLFLRGGTQLYFGLAVPDDPAEAACRVRTLEVDLIRELAQDVHRWDLARFLVELLRLCAPTLRALRWRTVPVIRGLEGCLPLTRVAARERFPTLRNLELLLVGRDALLERSFLGALLANSPGLRTLVADVQSVEVTVALASQGAVSSLRQVVLRSRAPVLHAEQVLALRHNQQLTGFCLDAPASSSMLEHEVLPVLSQMQQRFGSIERLALSFLLDKSSAACRPDQEDAEEAQGAQGARGTRGAQGPHGSNERPRISKRERRTLFNGSPTDMPEEAQEAISAMGSMKNLHISVIGRTLPSGEPTPWFIDHAALMERFAGLQQLEHLAFRDDDYRMPIPDRLWRGRFRDLFSGCGVVDAEDKESVRPRGRPGPTDHTNPPPPPPSPKAVAVPNLSRARQLVSTERNTAEQLRFCLLRYAFTVDAIHRRVARVVAHRTRHPGRPLPAGDGLLGDDWPLFVQDERPGSGAATVLDRRANARLYRDPEAVQPAYWPMYCRRGHVKRMAGIARGWGRRFRNLRTVFVGGCRFSILRSGGGCGGGDSDGDESSCRAVPHPNGHGFELARDLFGVTLDSAEPLVDESPLGVQRYPSQPLTAFPPLVDDAEDGEVGSGGDGNNDGDGGEIWEPPRPFFCQECFLAAVQARDDTMDGSSAAPTPVPTSQRDGCPHERTRPVPVTYPLAPPDELDNPATRHRQQQHMPAMVNLAYCTTDPQPPDRGQEQPAAEETMHICGMLDVAGNNIFGGDDDVVLAGPATPAAASLIDSSGSEPDTEMELIFPSIESDGAVHDAPPRRGETRRHQHQHQHPPPYPRASYPTPASPSPSLSSTGTTVVAVVADPDQEDQGLVVDGCSNNPPPTPRPTAPTPTTPPPAPILAPSASAATVNGAQAGAGPSSSSWRTREYDYSEAPSVTRVPAWAQNFPLHEYADDEDLEMTDLEGFGDEDDDEDEDDDSTTIISNNDDDEEEEDEDVEGNGDGGGGNDSNFRGGHRAKRRRRFYQLSNLTSSSAQDVGTMGMPPY